MKRYDLRAVLDATDLVALASEYTKLKKFGRQYGGKCPFHPEKTASFYVNPDKQVWYCHGACHAGGNAIKLLERAGMKFGDAVRMLAERAGVPATDEPWRMPLPSQKIEAEHLAADCEYFWRRQLLNAYRRHDEIWRLVYAIDDLWLNHQPFWIGPESVKNFRDLRKRALALIPRARVYARLGNLIQSAMPGALMTIYAKQSVATKQQIRSERVQRENEWEHEKKTTWEPFFTMVAQRWFEIEQEMNKDNKKDDPWKKFYITNYAPQS